MTAAPVISDIANLEAIRSPINNTDENIITLMATTLSTVYGPFYNPKRALRLAINISAITAGSLTVTLLGYDVSSGATWTIIATTALAGTGLTLIEVGPNIAASANAIAQDYAPAFYRVQVAIVTGPVTFTVGAHGLGA